MTLDTVIGLMGVSSIILASTFILLSFLSKKSKIIFLLFSIAFGVSAWGMFEYAIFLAGSDLFYLILFPGVLVPFLPFFLTSVILIIFLIYLLFKRK